MSQLLQQIRAAQIRAGEDAVIANLQSMGLARTERDRPAALAASEASQAKAKRENAKHTPGPWEVHPTTLHPAVRSVGTANAAPRRICTAGSMNGSPVDEHNARLIAAAPELLEALELIANTGMDAKQCMLTARAAIAKATGDPS